MLALRLVVDTNVLVSGLLSSRGTPAGIFNLVVNGDVILVLDTRIFDEYADVLGREKFGFPSDSVQEILAFIRREGLFTTPQPVSCRTPDPGDVPFIEVSLHAGAPVAGLMTFKILLSYPPIARGAGIPES